MQSPPRFSPIAIRLGSLFIALSIAASGILLLHHRYPDFLLAYHYVSEQMWEDMFGPPITKTSNQDQLLAFNTLELERMVMSTDQSARFAAIKALGEKNDLTVLPHLITLLNDTNPIELGPSHDGPTSIAEVSKEALNRLLRNSIGRDPLNLSILLPFLYAARSGTEPERSAVIEILGVAKEPLALPLLKDIAASEEGASVRKNAERAVAVINSSELENKLYRELRQRLFEIILASSLVILLVVFSLTNEIRKGSFGRITMLKVVSLALMTGLTAVVALEYERGAADEKTMLRAVSQRDLMALRTINYQDYTDFPGDSHTARSLVSMGKGQLIIDLKRVTTVEPDDLPMLKETMNKRSQWIAARIIVSRLDSHQLDRLVRDADPAVRTTVAATLGNIMVRNQAITDALAILSEDEEEEIRRIAQAGQVRIAQSPAWTE